MSDCLPEEVLERVLLKLPFNSLAQGKQVCKQWKQVMESHSFRRLYRDNVNLLESRRLPDSEITYEIVDSSNVARRLDVKPGIVLGGITTPETSLVLAHDDELEKFYVCNVFTGKWEEFPDWDHWAYTEDDRCNIEEICVFDLGEGKYRLVSWQHDGKVYMLTSEQKEWSSICYKPFLRFWKPAVVIIDNTVFCAAHGDNRLTLIEYDVLGNVRSHSPINSRDETFYQVYWSHTLEEFIGWEGKLYLALMRYDAGQRNQRILLWRISTEDGCAALEDTLEMEEDFTGCYFLVEAEDHEFIHICYGLEDETVASLSYNMVSHRVEKIVRRGRTILESRRMQAMLL